MKSLRLTVAVSAAALALVMAQTVSAWRSPSSFEGSIGHIISGKDAQASREPDTATGPDGSLIAVWSDQFAMKFGRALPNQGPEFRNFTVSTINGTAVPTGTAEDTSKPSVSIRADGKIAVAYMFNFAKAGGGNQHDVILITGQLDASPNGVTWDTPTPQRMTFSETDNAKRVSVAWDHAGVAHLAWEDAPDATPLLHVVRYMEVGSPDGPVVLSNLSRNATWPVLASDTGGPDRLHVVYTENGRVLERFAEAGRPRVFGTPTFAVGTNASRPDLAILPPASGSGGGTPIVVYDGDAACGKRQVFAAAPGVAAVQLSDCTQTANQEQATIAIRASDRTVYATWLRENNAFNTVTGAMEESRLEANAGWRWWKPIEVVPTSEVAGGWFQPSSTATTTGAQVLAVQLTAQFPSGQEIVHASNSQLDYDTQNVKIVPNPSGPGLKLSWTPFPNEAWHAIRILRKSTNDFAGPNDPTATVVGTPTTQIAVINGEYQVVPGGSLPSTFTDTTADPAQSYVYKLYVIHRGPTPATGFIQSPGYRFGTVAVWGSPPAPPALTPVPGPPAFELGVPAVGNFTITPGDSRVDLAWTNPSSFDKITVVRKLDADPADPTDGTVLLDGIGTSIADTAVTNGLTYHYAIWVQRDGALSLAIRGNATPLPPGAPFTYTAQPAGLYSGTAPSYTLGAVFHVTQAKALLKLGKAFQAGSFAGNQIGVWEDGSGLLVATATVSPASPSYAFPAPVQLQAGKKYVLGIKEELGSPWSPSRTLNGVPGFLVIDDAAFAIGATLAYPDQRDGTAGKSNEDWTMTFGPTDALPLVAPGPVTSFVALAGSARVDLSWTNPADFDTIKVVRKQGSVPTTPADGTVLYNGSGTSLADTTVANGTTYGYAVWSIRRGEPTLFPGVATRTPALPAGAVSYTSTPAGTYGLITATYNQGAAFHVTSDRTLLELGRIYQPGSGGPNQIGIWDAATQALLFSATVSSAASKVALSSPVTLTAGKSYVIGIKETVGTPWSGSRVLTGLPNFLVVDDTAFSASSVFAYPGGRDNTPGRSNEDWTMTFGVPGGLPVVNLRAFPGNARVDLAWTNPVDGGVVKVVRKAGADPASPSDGTLVYSGIGSTATDTGLTNGTDYHYAAWVARGPDLSAPARVTSTPSVPPVEGVRSLRLSAGDGRVDLAWSNPTPDFIAAIGDSLSTGGSIDSVGVDQLHSSWVIGDDPADGVQSHYERLLAVNPSIAGHGFNFAVSGSKMDATLAAADQAVATNVAYVTLMSGTNDVCGNSVSSMTPVETFRAQLRATLNRLSSGLPNAKILVSSIPDWTHLWALLGSNPAARSVWQSVGRCPSVLGATATDADRATVRQRIIELNQVLAEECVATANCRHDLNAAFDEQFTAADYTLSDYFHPSRSGQAKLAADEWNSGFWPDSATTQITVVRKVGAAPTGPADGTVVYTGAGNTAVDNAVTNGTVYQYGVWLSRGGVLSTPVLGTAVPSTVVSYTTQPNGDFSRTTAGFTIGAVFHVTTAKALVKLGRVYASGSSGGNRIGVWEDGTGVLLASASLTPLNPVAALATPLALVAGKKYVIGVQETAGSPWSSGRLISGLPAFLVVDDSAYASGTALSYPSGRDNQTTAPIALAEDWTMTFAPPGTPAVTLPDPVMALAATPGDTRVDLAWANPVTAFDRVLVVRKVGVVPANPDDGAVAYTGTGTSLADTGLANGTPFRYAVWVQRGGELSPAQAASATPTGVLPDPVTSLQASAGDTRIDLVWANPTSPFDRVVIVRKSGSAPSSPSDGTLVYTGTDTSFADTGLANNTLYNYGVWVGRGTGLSAARRVSAMPASSPVSPVTNLVATAGDTQVALAWTNPAALDAVLVVRKLGGAPADPTDGTVILNALGSSVNDTGLVNGTTAYYGIWVTKGGQISSPLRTSAVPAVPAPSPVAGFTAVPGDRRVDLTWTNPAGAFDSVQVVRKAGTMPTGPTDGTLVFVGNAAAAADAGLTNGTLYHYAAWVTRGGVFSPAARAQAIPVDPAGVVTYAAQPVGTYTGQSPLYNLGVVFHVTQDKVLLKLGRAYKAGSTASNQIGIWDDTTQVLLTSATVSPATPVANLVAPLVLRAGKKYVLGVKESLGSPWSGGRAATGVPSFLVIDDAAYNQGATFSFPNLRDQAAGRVNEDWAMTFGAVGVVPVAPDPVTALAAAPGESRVDLTWSNPSAAFDQIVVVRKQGSAPIDPTDGTTVYTGIGTSATDIGLTNGVGYQYAVWVQGSGLLSLVSRTTATPAAAPPGAVTGLRATAGDTQVVLSWTNPSGSFDQVIVERKAGGTPTTPTDGTRVYTGTGTAATDTGLANGTVYSYAVWVSRGGVLSSAATVSSTPSSFPLDPVTALVATGVDLGVQLSWTNPVTPFDFVQVVRKQGTDPTGPTDGTLVYSGSGTTLLDGSLVNGTLYRYAVWTVRSGVFSAVVRAGATPAAGTLLPVTGLQATAGNFRVDLSWANPAGRIDFVKVVRKVGAAPADPTDGALIFSGIGTSVADTGLSNGTTYQYAVWVQRDGAFSTAARIGATPVDPAATVTYAATPVGTYGGTAATYNLGAVFHVTASKVLLSLGRTYKAGSTAGNQVGVWDGTTGALLASASVTPAAPAATLGTPLALTAGKSYVVGVKEAIGSPWSGGRTLTGLPTFLVIDDSAFGNSATFSYPNLRDNKPGQSNEDWVMSFGGVAPPPVPDPVTGLAAAAGDTRIDLSWTNPATAFDTVRVVRKAGGAPADPTDGTTVYTGTGTAVADTGLANGTTYQYAVWTSSLGVLSAVARTSAIPVPPAPNPVTGLDAVAGDASVALTWTAPAGTYDSVQVVRKAGSAPVDPSDGTLVTSGTATSFTDTGLTNGTTYHYAVWAVRVAQLSAPARASSIPSLLTAYTTQPRGDFSRDPALFAVGNLGTVFHVTQSRVLLELGRVYGAGSTASNTVGIWEDGTGALLASATVDPLSPVAALSTPLTLTAGKKYVLGVKQSAGSPWSSPRPLAHLPGFLVVDDSAYNTDITGFSYPGQRDGQSQPISIADDWTLVFGPPGSAAVTLPDPVSGLAAAPGDTHVGLSWTNPATSFDRVVVVRKTGLPPAGPTDGTVVYSGTAATFTDTGLLNGTLYRYGVWTQRSIDSSSARLVSSTPTGAVPDPVTGLAAAAVDQRVDLTWANPTSGFDTVLVVRKAGSAPANPADGTQIYAGTGNAVADTGLVNGTLYVYAVWVGRGADLSASRLASATPTALPASSVTSLQAAPGDAQVALSWTPPTAFDTIIVVRKAGGSPADPTDGTTVYNGTGSLFVDTGLVNGTSYGYAVWTHRGSQLSAPVRVSATPSVQPPSPVTGLHAVAGNARVDLSWTAPAGTFDAVVVVRKAGSPPADPTDGTTVYSGTGTFAADTGLQNGVAYYHYAVWTQRSTALSTPVRAVTIPVDPALTVAYSATPSGDFANAAAQYVLGTVFHVTTDKLLLTVGRSYKPGSAAGNQIGVWEDGTGLLLATAAVSPGASTAALGTPLLLAAGKRYVIGIKQVAGSPWSGARALNGVPSFLVIDDTAYTISSTFTYPDLRDNQAAPIRVADDWSMSFGSASGLPTAPAPVTGLAATASDGRVDLAWTNPATAFDAVQVVRKTGSAPNSPADGLTVYTGTGTAAADTGLANGTTYYYGAWTQRAGLYSAATQATATPTVVAPAAVSGLVANPGDAQVLLSWTNPAGFFDDVRVVRKAGSAPTGPLDGTVVYVGIGTSALDTALVNNTLYHYAVWVERGGLASPVVRTSATPVPTPLDPVGNVTATPGDFTVALTWTNPTTPFDLVKVVRKTGTPPTDPTDGTLVYGGTGTSVTASGLTNGTLTYFGIWTQRSGQLSAPARVTATPTPPPLPGVTGLTATPSDSQVALAWTNPTGRWDFVVVVAKTGGVPAGPTDGTTVYNGTGSSVADTGLTNGITRTYRVWVSRDGTLSTPAQAVATPLDQASIIGYSVQPLGAYANTAATYTAGAVFHVTDDKVLLGVGRTYKAGSTAGNQIGIWDAASQTLLGSVSVTPASPSATFATPVVLVPGTSYVIGIKEQIGSPWSAAHLPANLPGFLVIDDSAFVSSTTFAYPSGRDNKPGQTNDDWSMTFAAVGTVAAPAPVTGLAAVWNDTRNTLTWTNPAGKIDVVQVVRKAGADPADPTDGTLVYSAAGTTVVDTGLTNGTAYHYGVWAVRAGKLSTVARVTSIPNVPVDAVTAFSVGVGDLRATLAWANPTTRFDTVKIVRKAGSAPVDQTDGTQVYAGTGTTFVDTGLANGTTYYYVAWVERDGLLSPLARASVTPVAPPLQTVGLLQAVVGNHRADLSWVNPPMRIDGVQVVRKVGSAPADPTDGTTVYSGTGTSAADTGLVNGTNYTYGVWVLRDGSVSTRADAVATPFDATSIVTATAKPTGNYAGSSAGYTMGAVFHVTDDKQLTALGRVYTPGNTLTFTGPPPPAVQVVLENPSFLTLAVDRIGVAYGKSNVGSDPTRQNTLYRSTDEGRTWSAANTFPAHAQLNYLTVLGSNTLLASVDYLGSTTIWRSTNGFDWTNVLTLPNTPILYGTLTPHSITDVGGHAYLGTYNTGTGNSYTNYLYRSDDDGQSWNVVNTNTGHRHIHFVQADPTTGKIYVNFGDNPTGDGTWVSSDLGVTLAPRCTVYQCVAVDMAFDPAGFALFGTDNPFSQNAIYKLDLTTGAITGIRNIVYDSWSAFRLGGGNWLIGTGWEQGVPKPDPNLHLYASNDNGATFVDVFQRPICCTTGEIKMQVQYAYPNGDFPIQVGGNGTIVGHLVPATAPTPVPNQIGIWDATTGTLLASATISQTSPTAQLAIPITLHAGTRYVVGIKEENGTLWSGSRTLTNLPGFLVVDDTAYNVGSTFAYPAGRDNKPGQSNEDWTMTFAAVGDPVAGGPVTGLEATAGDARVALAWTNPAAVDLVKVVRKAGAVAPADPTDGTVAYSGSANAVIDTGLANDTTYTYAVWAVRGGVLSAVSTVTATPRVPGVLSLLAILGDTKVDLTWTNPPVAFDRVHVVRKASSPPATVADGTTVYTGTGSSFSDTGLTNDVTYHYAVWVERGALSSLPVRISSTPTFPNPNPVTALQATPGDLRVALAWTAPTGTFDSIAVVRKAGATGPADPTDGVTVYSGLGTSFLDLTVANGTTYQYGVWVLRGTKLSTPARVTALPVAPPLVGVAGLSAIGGNARVDLAWTNPAIRFDLVHVVRKPGSAPTGIADGTEVYTGTGSAAADTGLTNGVTYNYAVYVERDGALSTPTRAAALTVDPTTQVTYTSTPLGTYAGTLAGYTLGAVFHVSVDKALVKLGRTYKAGSTAGNTVGIWDEATQALLVSVSVTLAAPVATLATPLQLQAGKRYVLGVQAAAGSPWSGAHLLTGLPGFLVVDDTAYAVGNGLLYPNGRDARPGQSNDDWAMTFAPVGSFAAPNPVTALTATAGDATVSLAWTNPATPFDTVQVVRKAGGAPASPADGTAVYTGTGTAFVDSALTNGTTYGYAVWATQSGVLSTPATATATPAIPPVTGFVASPSDTRVDLSWANPAAPFDRVIAVRKAAADPVDTTDGTTVFSGTGTSASDTGLTNGVSYHYAVWVQRGLLLSGPVRATATPAFGTPSPVTGLTATPGDLSVALAWTNPSGTFDAVRVVRKAGVAPADPTDGTVAYSGTGTSLADTGLTNGTNYQYGVWAVRGTNFSVVARVTATPAAGTVGSVSGLTATAGNAAVTLAWTAPSGRVDSYLVTRKPGAAPADPADGTAVAGATASGVADAGLTNGVTYSYAVWAVRDGGLSPVTRAVATPLDPATVVTVAATPTGTYSGVAPTYVLGVVFHLTSDQLLLKLGKAFAPGSTAAEQIGIWDDAAHTLLASATISPGSPVATLITPIVLRAGTAYVLGIKEETGSLWSAARLITGLPAFFVVDDTAFSATSVFGFPAGRDNKPGQSNEDWTMSFAPAPGP